MPVEMATEKVMGLSHISAITFLSITWLSTQNSDRKSRTGVVPRERLELSQLSPADFESAASTNSATPAQGAFRAQIVGDWAVGVKRYCLNWGLRAVQGRPSRLSRVPKYPPAYMVVFVEK